MANEILEESQYLILHNNEDDKFHRHTIEIASSLLPNELSWQIINEDEKLISNFVISERMAKQIISFLKNHFNL